MDDYLKGVQKLKDVFMLKITDGNYVESDGDNDDIKGFYNVKLRGENKSDKNIKEVKGESLLKNEKGNVILKYSLESNILFSAHQIIEGQDREVILSDFLGGDDQNALELKSIPFEKIKQEWMPKLIIFDNGDRLEAPKKPILE